MWKKPSSILSPRERARERGRPTKHLSNKRESAIIILRINIGERGIMSFVKLLRNVTGGGKSCL
jgi:hypothetical protein